MVDSQMSTLNNAAKDYVQNIIDEALKDDPFLDPAQFARLIEGELEEFSMVSSIDSHLAISEIESMIVSSQSH